MLVAAIVFDYLAATESLLTSTEDGWLDYVRLPMLPRHLAVLAMLVAASLDLWQTRPLERTSTRRKVTSVFAAAGTLVALFVYWADRMFIVFLVYLAVSGVEAAQPPQLVPPEMNVSTEIRINRFALAGFAGLPMLLANVLLIGDTRGMVEQVSLPMGIVAWSRRRPGSGVLARDLDWHLRRVAAIATVLRCNRGPAMGDYHRRRFDDLPRGDCRCLANASQPSPGSAPAPISARTLYFHETWLGSVLFGAMGTAMIVTGLIFDLIDTSPTALNSWRSRTIDWQSVVYSLTLTPAQFISWAAVLGGFTWAYVRWERKADYV